MGLSYWDYSLIIGFIITIVYWYIKKKLSRFEESGIKYIHPITSLYNFFRSILLIDTNIIKSVEKTYKTYPNEKYIGGFELSKPIIWINDPEIIKQITIKDFDHFTDHRSFFNDNIDNIFTNSLVALKGQKWKDMRATLSPAFTTSKMRAMFPLIEECNQRLVNFIEDETKLCEEKGLEYYELELKEFFTRYANDIIATCAFGISINSVKDKTNPFYKMGMEITNFTTRGFLTFFGYMISPRLMKILRIPLIKEDVANFFKNLVSQTMQAREEKGIVRHDMINLLMQAKNKGYIVDDDNIDNSKEEKEEKKENKSWSDDELAAQAFVFFLAGFETISVMLTFCAYEIARNPDIQTKLQYEIDELLHNEKITYDSLAKLTYMDMFISEILRYSPLALGSDRVCVKPYNLPSPNGNLYTDYKINVGEIIFIPTYSIHRDPKYFYDADKFIPERFSEENKTNIKPFTYLPFGSGPRICIGSRFALMEVKSIILTLLSRFNFVKCSKTEDITTSKLKPFSPLPINGIWIALKPRK